MPITTTTNLGPCGCCGDDGGGTVDVPCGLAQAVQAVPERLYATTLGVVLDGTDPASCTCCDDHTFALDYYPAGSAGFAAAGGDAAANPYGLWAGELAGNWCGESVVAYGPAKYRVVLAPGVEYSGSAVTFCGWGAGWQRYRASTGTWPGYPIGASGLAVTVGPFYAQGDCQPETTNFWPPWVCAGLRSNGSHAHAAVRFTFSEDPP